MTGVSGITLTPCVRSDNGRARCLRLEGDGSTQAPCTAPQDSFALWLSQYFGSILPQVEHRSPCPLPALLIVLEQQSGLPTILGVCISRQSFSKCIEPSGELSPAQLTMSPGCNDLNSLFTGPPSWNASSLTGCLPVKAKTCEWPPRISSGLDITVPLFCDSI
ncbi:uncharacterized protein METZ01_LOCUS492141 [marine metagenome]|uniref:Uncharacterized protein n=1 Tax=marine metagenome TaxID=408172 RepID=A0A383D404_9ZZZZ